MPVVFGMGPNGQIGPVMTLEPSEPTEYDGFFTTPEGVMIKLNMQTSNKALADQYCVDVAKAMQWQLGERPETTASFSGDILGVWSAAFIAAIALPILMLMTGMVFKSAGYMSYETSEWLYDNMAKAGIWTFVIVGLVLTVAVCVGYLSGKRND
jgi:hypothetical protein